MFNEKGVDKTHLEICKKKIEKTLNLWNGIKFNLIDKITVIRTFGFSKLWYLLNFLTLSEEEIKVFELMAFKYIWNGNAELISRSHLYSEFKNGGLNMVCIRAKINMIFIRNLLYIKKNMNRLQYQLSIYWMKLYFREYLNNYNIVPGGLDSERPKYYVWMIDCLKKFNLKFESWSTIENESRKKKYESKFRKAVDKSKIKPFLAYDKKFLNNSTILSSKLIYNLFLKDFNLIKKLPYQLKDQEKIFLNIHKINSSSVRLVNYKLIFNGLPTNYKFNNRYDQECFMCKKKLDENIEHIFVKCKYSKESFEYLRNNFLTDKSLINTLVLLDYKRNVCDGDYRILSCFVYSIWRVRNALKHNEKNANPFEVFKIYFNKWLISLTNI